VVLAGLFQLCTSLDNCWNKSLRDSAKQEATETDRERRRAELAERDENQREAERAAAEARRVSDLADADLATTKALKPWQRAEKLQKCWKDASECPEGGIDVIVKAAATDAERRQLERNLAIYRKVATSRTETLAAT
jgi:hypothetical protein